MGARFFDLDLYGRFNGSGHPPRLLEGLRVDSATLKTVMGNRSGVNFANEVAGCDEALRLVGATTVLRAAHFLAQVGHESAGLYYTEEIASGAAYEGRKNLGNVVVGDGVRFKGRSFVQVTGRYNYRLMSEWAHSKGLVPTATYFVDNPTHLAAVKYRWLGPVWYFTTQRPGWKAAADRDDVVAVTKMVNGGTNGLADRKAYLARAKAQGKKILPTGTNGASGSTTGGTTVGFNYYTVEPHATRRTTSYNSGRGGKKVQYITRHHMAANWNLAQCVNMWNTSQTSAHYTINGTGGVGQAVYDGNTAWSNGNYASNQVSISIEHANSSLGPSWSISDATIRAGARWAAALCLYYKLGRPVFGKNIRDHKEFNSTACPMHLANGGKYHAAWMSEAQSFYDLLAAKKVNADGSLKAGTSPATNTTEDGMSAKAEKQIGEIHHQLLNKWDQLGGMTLVDALADVRKDVRLTGDQLAGPGRKDGARTFGGWDIQSALEALRRKNYVGATVVEAVAVLLVGTDADVAALRGENGEA